MQIVALPLLQDNYAWLLTAPGSNDCAVVDPSEGPAVRQLLDQRGLRLRAILATHHHPDHVDGIAHLLQQGVRVVASRYDAQRVPHANHLVDDGDVFEVLGHSVECLLTPGHTLGAVAYHVAAAQAVFTGDTLFVGGCGRLFEGTPAQMLDSLRRLAALPDDTLIYCGHEYTQKNLEFAASIEPQSEAVGHRLAEVRALRQQGRPTVPASLQLDRQTNPFLRAGSPPLLQHFATSDPLEAFTRLRQARNHF